MVCVLVTQLCPTLCNPMDYNSQGSSVHGILQARILQWVDISFSGIAEGGEAKITLGGACVSPVLPGPEPIGSLGRTGLESERSQPQISREPDVQLVPWEQDIRVGITDTNNIT